MNAFFDYTWSPGTSLHTMEFPDSIAAMTDAEIDQLITESEPLYMEFLEAIKAHPELSLAHQAWAAEVLRDTLQQMATEKSCDA